MSSWIVKSLTGWASAGGLTLIFFAIGLRRHYRHQVVTRRGFPVRPRP